MCANKLNTAYLRLNGINAREQPVFKELTRVRQYFDKINALDAPDMSRLAKLDKGAAARFIKAGLVYSPIHWKDVYY
jgi:exosome complex protein LRP1